LQRISDIESLGRTREVVAKDLVLGGKYKITGGKEKLVELVPKEEEGGKQR
jgi:hypothetical protein